MNPCNADHRIIEAAHNPAVTERHAVIYSAVAKDGVARNLTCLHIKFAFVVKRFSFLERIKTNSLFAMLSTNFHFYLPRNTNAHFIHSGMFAENKPLYIKMESTIDETATTAIKAITTPCRMANFLRLLSILFSMSYLFMFLPPPHRNSRTSGQTHVGEQPDKHCMTFFKQVVCHVFDCPFGLNYHRQQD
jgi:hypothetical protein|uniref:Uncharacterized protein n=1 Tax=Siphoviridae sp. ctQqU1 TaxID=2825496 RepID=A0A8S5Q371_9CAUD|nr:MAG TPA: hypothetical protein [Siphoviridae sp. ctQqU1]